MEAACPVDEMVAAMLPGSGGKGIAVGEMEVTRLMQTCEDAK